MQASIEARWFSQHVQTVSRRCLANCQRWPTCDFAHDVGEFSGALFGDGRPDRRCMPQCVARWSNSGALFLPSLRLILTRYVSTVLGLICILAAIASVVIPWPIDSKAC